MKRKHILSCCVICIVSLLALVGCEIPFFSGQCPCEKQHTFSSGIADLGDTKLYYEITGKGPAVILIHAHSADRRMWDEQFASLAGAYKVVRYDMRGYGLSDLPVEGEKFYHADDLNKLMNYLGIKKAHLVGLSLGSFVATDMLLLHPEKVRSIAIAAGGIRDTNITPQTTPAQKAKIQAEELKDKLASIEKVKKQGLDKFKKEWFDNLIGVSGKYADEIAPDLWQMINDWSGWQATHVEASWQLEPTVLERLAKAQPKKPILIIIGKEDAPGSINSSEYMARLIPKAKKLYLPDVGHFSNMETPQAFTTALIDFWESPR